MEFTSLPDEIFAIILKMLDLTSIYNFYNAFQYARNFIQSNTIVQNWFATMNNMASAKYLNSIFFKDVAFSLNEINLCGVPDLCKTRLLSAIKRTRSLKTLDVSYTDITIIDFCDMYHSCPTIKNIALNFVLDKSNIKIKESEVIIKYQNVFKNMDNIHFVGSSLCLLYSNIAVVSILKQSDLNILKFTIVNQETPDYIMLGEQYTPFLKFNEFYVYFMSLGMNYGNYSSINLFREINVENFDKIIIVNEGLLSEIIVYVTPIFKEFFNVKFGITTISIAESNKDLRGNIGIMIFNKKTVKYDLKFFERLYKRVKNYFPFVFKKDGPLPLKYNYDWYFASPVVSTESKDKDHFEGFKKRRVGNSNITLDYDAVFKEKHKIMLSLAFTCNFVNPVSLSSNSNYLTKLTFLSLSGDVRYSVEFFNILFRCCNNLATLVVVAPSISPCISPVSRSIPLSKTLKNIRLVDRRFDFKTFFLCLSQCKTLENIHIIDESSEYTLLADPSTLFANCKNLYNISITACMTDTKAKEIKRVFNKTKVTHNRPQIKVNISQTLSENYDPSFEVFNMFPIKPGLSFS